MGLIKSMFKAARANSYAYEGAQMFNKQIHDELGHKTTVSPKELYDTVRMVTLDDKITEAVFKAVGFKDMSDSPKVINQNDVFDAILTIMDARAKQVASMKH